MSPLQFRRHDRIGYLTLNRPEQYNAFNEEMVQAFEAFVADRRRDTETLVLILDGGDAKGFCAGLDIKEYLPKFSTMAPIDAYQEQARMSRLFLGMRQIPQPIICCVHGSAAGIGFSLAMASDVRVLADDARLCAAYINIGLGGADMASSYFLPRLIGAGRAYEFLLTGNWMDAATARDLGLASRVVPREALVGTAEELAGVMAEKNPLGLRMTKEAINCNLDCAGLEAALHVEDRNQIMISYTHRMGT